MTPNEPRVDDLRVALTDDVEGTVSTGDVELVQRAVAGELDENELESLLDRLHLEPALAEAWRTAVLVRDELAGRGQAERPARLGRWYAVVGLAAAVVLAVAIPSLLQWRGERGPVMRESPRDSIASLLEDGAPLPREAFDLAWRVSGEHGVFRIHVLDSDLEVLHDEASLQNPELRVPAAALAGLEPGSTVLWWVETTAASGRRVRSATFVQRVR
jgi:hypothetical protein